MTDSFHSIPSFRRHCYVCALLLGLGAFGHSIKSHFDSNDSLAQHAPLNSDSEQMRGIEAMLK